MGNVQASESGVPPPGAPPGGPPDNDKNPGTVEDLHKECKELFPMAFEGGKLVVQKALSNNFQVDSLFPAQHRTGHRLQLTHDDDNCVQVSHSLTMSNMMPSGYRFGATYVGGTILSPQEAYPVLMGDIDPSGNLQAHIIHAPTTRTRQGTKKYRVPHN